ncbi:Mitochondrial matrix iron chaperone [Coemansia javaensis]|uniref:ferroxidase n=1 Tax=Coemansia javaensis TaxID=2761396 RepID=A0A9W8HFI6_9FUNG|nr:Mitochondrial matrix iron chaperone [Coemansia javaensis]
MAARLVRALLARGSHASRGMAAWAPLACAARAGAPRVAASVAAAARIDTRRFGASRGAATAAYTASALTDRQYDAAADAALGGLVEYLEDLGDEIETEDYDVEYAQGVLTLTVGRAGTYVINKQPPNKQIWLSSPVSGPERYDFDCAQGAWFCRHTGESLGALLGRELSQALGVRVEPPIA